jgi:hypothetical protein
MPAFKRFVAIGAWLKARELTIQVYAVTNTGEFARDYFVARSDQTGERFLNGQHCQRFWAQR